MAKYMTAEALALAIKKDVQTVRRYCREGRFGAKKDPGGRGWLIPEDEFDKALEKFTTSYFDKANG